MLSEHLRAILDPKPQLCAPRFWSCGVSRAMPCGAWSIYVEEEVEHRPLLEVPADYEDRANNDTWDWDANQVKVEEAEKLLRETDRCCFCDFDCQTPSAQENEGRLFGVLQSLWDHIELSHPLAFEWLG